ncbi:MAG TPA: tetratricopeptide repeat protein [Trebonia sp.]|nr:tetratricopeptide repeat protein [Trebonia sp.]
MWALLYCTSHHALLRDIEAARGCCEQGSELARDRNNPMAQSFARCMMGFVCQANGDLEGAIACFLDALDIVPVSGPASQGVRAETLAELGETYQAAGDPRSARQAWQQALELYESLHHPAADQMRARLDQVPGS